MRASLPPPPARLRLTACTWLLAVLSVALAPRARADAPQEPATRAQAALRRLASPLLADRQEAVGELVRMLPGVRARVVQALPRASWSVQGHLIEVLSRDGTPAALDALLEHLTRAEATQAVWIQRLLARDPDVAARLLALWREDPVAFLKRAQAPGGAARLAALVRVLRRSEIEALFLGRKSKTGSTGYYKGQYDVLKGAGRESDYREHALEVVTGVALDEAIRTPGLYTSGVYHFLRPHHVDEWELKAMALNAVAELCSPQDTSVLARLEQRRQDLLVEREEHYERMRTRYYGSGGEWEDKSFQDTMQEWEDAYAEGLDVLACLYQISPERYGGLVREAIVDLETMRGVFVPLSRRSYIAALLIRVGWYDEAIEAYESAMYGGGGSKALGYYNMACAAAGAARAPGLSTERRAERLDEAVRYLWFSVDAGWSDLEWMNEDRDLDPLREHRRNEYDHVAERLKAMWHVPDEGPKPPK